MKTTTLKIANRFGNVDARCGIPKGYVHVRGQRLQPLCRKLGIEFAEALVGFCGSKPHFKPVLNGVVIRSKDAERLRAEIQERTLRTKAREDRERRKQEKDELQRHELRRKEFRERFPAASEETIQTHIESRLVYSQIEDVPLDALLAEEIEDLGFSRGGQAGVVLLDSGATVVPLYVARLCEDSSPNSMPEDVYEQAIQLGFTSQKALWILNKLVKLVQNSPKQEVYGLKDQLLLMWSEHLIDGRIARREVRECWECGGSGEHWSGADCHRCDGSGVFSSRTLYEVRYSFPSDDRTYCYHTFSKPHIVSGEPGADLPAYGRRLTSEERRSIPFGFHDLLRILKHEVVVQRRLIEERHRATLHQKWVGMGLPPLSPTAPKEQIEQCLSLISELSAG